MRQTKADRGISVWTVRYEQIRAGGVAVAAIKARRLLERLFWTAFWLAAYPVILVLRPVVVVRLGQLCAWRIGHFTYDLAYYLAERRLGMHPRRSLDLFFFSGNICNAAFARLCQRYLNVWDGVSHGYRIFSRLPFTNPHIVSIRAVVKYRYRDNEGTLARSPRVVYLSDAEQQQGWRELQSRWGVPKDARIACFQVRSNAYLDAMPMLRGSAKAIELRDRNSHKNADIVTFERAMLMLAERGYYCFRMGAVPDKPLGVRHERIIDYANDRRSDFLDIFLCANSQFIVSTGTGIDALADLFRKPVAFCNQVTIEAIHAWMPHLTIFKKYRWRKTGKPLTLSEIFQSGLSACFDAREFEAKGVELFDNTEEEIVAVVDEMLAIQDGDIKYTNEDEARQAQFWSALEGSRFQGVRMGRVGNRFLRDNAWLLN